MALRTKTKLTLTVAAVAHNVPIRRPVPRTLTALVSAASVPHAVSVMSCSFIMPYLSSLLVAATCSDSVKNQDETDVDCGGSTCGKCANTKICNVNSDCTSLHCNNNFCGMFFSRPRVDLSLTDSFTVSGRCLH
jgi:hypothetical protein